MSFIFADPVCGYTTVADSAKRGWNVSGNTLAAGRFGLQAFRMTNSANWLFKAFPATAGRIIVQFSIKFDAHISASKFFRIWNNSGAEICLELGVSAADALQVYNAAGTLVATTAGGLLAPDRWNTIAVEAQIGSSTGTVKVWVNQPSSGATPIVNLAGIDLTDTSGAGADTVDWMLQSVGGAPFWNLSEVLIYDTSGPAPMNAYLGDKRLHVLLPNGAGSATAWTQFPASTSNFDKVDDPITAAPDADATYNGATTGAGADLYAFGDLPAGTTGIVGVVEEAELRKTDAGVISPQLRMRANATNLDSAAISPFETYTKHQHFSADVPGGTGWTEANVNGMEAGQVI